MKFRRAVAFPLLAILVLADRGRPDENSAQEKVPVAVVSVEAMRDIIRQRTARFDGKGRVFCGNESLCGSPVLPRFYEARDFVPAWTAEGRPTTAMEELATAIREASTAGLDPANYRFSRIQSFIDVLKKGRGPTQPEGFVDLDMILTDSFLLMASHLESGMVNPKTIKADWHIKSRQADLPAVLQNALASQTVAASLHALHPQHPWYRSLEEALPPLYEIQKKGGWGEVPAGPTLKEGATGPRAEALRRRLIGSGDMPAAEPAGPVVLDGTLGDGVKRFQARHGLEPDGAVGPATLEALNVPVERRLDQVKANLERWRWLPSDFGERYILVNIASFTLDVIEGGRSTMRMPVIVGRDYRETPVFGADLTYLELNPFWTVPPKLAVEDILPKVQKDPGYLAAKGIRIFSGWSEGAAEVDPSTVDWSRLGRANFPYRLRQDPGPGNALGHIIFMMPNEHAVYLHDTPERELFERAERVFSSGCIRLADPVGLAEHLLAGEKGWDRRAIEAAIERGATRVVRLSRPIPVFMVYLTAWVGDSGVMHFERDVYGRDGPLIRALAEPFLSPRPDGTDVHVDKVGLGIVPHPSRF